MSAQVRTVAKRQCVGHELDRGRGARGALAQHRQRRITGDDEQHTVELKRGTRVHCGDDVPDVDWIEGAFNSYGLIAVCLLMLGKAAGIPFPIPGDLILLATAARAALRIAS